MACRRQHPAITGAGCIRDRHSGARVKRANPESITTIGSMDSGPAPSGASRNDGGGFTRPMRREPPHLSRRRLLNFVAAGLSAIAMPGSARAQLATQAPPKRAAPDEFSVTAPVAIEVKAQPIPAFDPRDPQRLRFGALEYRSGLVLTSRFPGFGGLSAWRWRGAKGGPSLGVGEHGRLVSGRHLVSA